MDEFDPTVAEDDRRAFLSKFGKAALVAPPAITMLLSTSMSSPAIARSAGDPKGNNGVGNGYDPQPPGNPPVNDGEGTGPGNPGNNGGNNNNNNTNNGNGNGNGNNNVTNGNDEVHGHGHH
jgi:hypothetical protein